MSNIEFYQRGQASVVIDGQYGSTGKGLLAGYLALQSTMEQGHVVHTTNAAPNAGHTTIWRDLPHTADGMMVLTEQEVRDVSYKKLVTYHLPTGGVLRRELCWINAGAVIDMALLMKERHHAEEVMNSRLMVQVDPAAVILLPEDSDDESDPMSTAARISSTQKGVGAAIARKVRRAANLMQDYRIYDPSFSVKVARQHLERFLKHGRTVSIEVPQGLSLGLNYGGFYPYCTGREVSIAQAMSDAGIHPRYLGPVALSMRTFPIRVGSLPGGTSGGHYHDQIEITWDQLPVPGPELTTVTKRPRRVFTWSREQYRDALYKTLPSIVFLNFVNYFKDQREFADHVVSMEEDHDLVGHKPQVIYGLGPTISDVVDNYADASLRLDQIIEERKSRHENQAL